MTITCSVYELEVEQRKLSKLEVALDACEDDQTTDNFMLIRIGLSILQTSFAEFTRLMKVGHQLNQEEALLLIETFKESESFLSMHEDALVREH